jgi:lipoate-protein ligase A
VKVTACGKTDESSPTRGPFFCFARRHTYDLLLGENKIVGSAQRRTRAAILQHGSIIYGNRFPQQQAPVLSVAEEEVVEHVRSTLCKELQAASGMMLELGEWTDAELRDAEALTSKYTGYEWARRK